MNYVFRIGSGPDAVIRFARDPSRPDGTRVEQWCLRAAAAAGIPSPRVRAEGRLDDIPYLIEEFVAGDHDGSATSWRTLGSYAAMLSGVTLDASAPDGLFSRFGRDLPAAWSAHVDYNLGALTEGDPLVALGVYPPARRTELRTALGGLRDRAWTFGLAHRDLHPRNLITTADGRRVLLDWDTAQAGPTPWLDASRALRAHLLDGSPTESELRTFLEGCALPPEHRPILDALVVLAALDIVRWAIDRRPDLTADLAEQSRRLLRSTATP